MRDLPAADEDEEPAMPPPFNAFRVLRDGDDAVAQKKQLTITVPPRAAGLPNIITVHQCQPEDQNGIGQRMLSPTCEFQFSR
jgi:hypothetical protein